jgi:hypothetical protein
MTIILSSPGTPTILSDYVTQVQRLLHDSNAQFTSVAEVNDYVNEARIRTVRDTGCYRVLQTVYLSTGVEVYNFGGVTGFNVTNQGAGYGVNSTVSLSAPGVTGGVQATATPTITAGKITSIQVLNRGTLYQSAPAVTITPVGGGAGAAATAYNLHSATIDAVNVSVFWGNTRRVLGRWDWTNFNAKARGWVQYLGLPSIFSVYSYNQLYIAKIPDQTYQAEVDSVLEPPPLVDDTTIEVIPLVMQDPIQYFAAHLAKIKAQRWDEADRFYQRYREQVLQCINSSFTRALKYPYG